LTKAVSAGLLPAPKVQALLAGLDGGETSGNKARAKCEDQEDDRGWPDRERGGALGGGYGPQGGAVGPAPDALQLAPLAVQAAMALGLDKNAAAISANQYVRKITGQNLLESFDHADLPAENQSTQWFTPTALTSA
jgi:hypothetical protein